MSTKPIIRIMITLLSMVTLLTSCSIKEVRGECPCYLDIAVMRQAGELFPDNKSWCSVWNGNDRVYSDTISPVVGADAVTSCAFPRNRRATVVVSNTEQNTLRVTIPSGKQMSKLYMTRKDIDCVGDNARVEFDSFSKQYINVTFTLNEDAYQHKDNLTLTLNGPYDGVSLPSMEPHLGTFSYRTGFDADGKVTMRISPQGGPGIKASIQLDSNPPATVDLYHLMIDAGFDFKSESLNDFDTILGLNTVSSIIEVKDWTVVEIGGITY